MDQVEFLEQRRVGTDTTAGSTPDSTGATLGPASHFLTERAGALDGEELRFIDAWSCAANFLSVDEINLRGGAQVGPEGLVGDRRRAHRCPLTRCRAGSSGEV